MKSILRIQGLSLVRKGVTVLWVVLFILLLQPDVFITSINPAEEQALQQAEREEYQGVYFRDQKIGYVINHYVAGENNSLAVDQKAHINLNVGEVIHQVDLHLQAELGSNYILRKFSFTFESPFYKMSAKGRVDNNRIHITLTTDNTTIENSLEVDGPPMVPTARRGYLLKPELEAGTKVKIPWFDPMSLTAKNAVVEYHGREPISISGRVHNLHRFTENYGGARINLWLNEDGDVMKEESPAGFVFIKEPKFRALRLAEASEELLSAVAVKIVGSMPELDALSSMQYRLEFPEDEDFDLDNGRQQYADRVLTIHRELLPDSSKTQTVVEQSCTDIGKSLASTPYIQTDDKRIADLAAEVGEDAESVLERIEKLADWVYQHIDKRPVLGIPDALTTLSNLRGDCNEHAALFAALARNSGIPTRIAVGVVFHKGAFYYHAWNEVCAGDQWFTIDTTTDQFPADLSHIKFIQGDLNEHVRIGALIGRLSIEPLSAETQTGKE